MRRSMLTLTAALMSTTAMAADFPVKARVVAPGYPYLGSGFYFGIGTEGVVANATAAAPGAGTNLYAAGADLNAAIGYQGSIGGGSNWYAAELKLAYQNLGGSQLCGVGSVCTVASKFDVEERFLIGFPVAAVLALLPSWGSIFPALPAQPPGVVTSASHPYLGLGLHESPVVGTVAMPGATMSATAWQVQPAVIVGMKNQWTAGLVVDTWAEYSFANTSFSLGGGAAANQGSTARVGLSFQY